MANTSKFRLLFRYLCSIIFLIGLSYHFMEIDLECYKSFGGRYKYLTLINMFLQWIYFTTVTVIDVQAFARKRNSEIFSYICDFCFASWAFPIALTVTVLFWGLYMIDPYSCQTEEEAKIIPRWFNHYMHTFPAIAVVLELLLFKHEYPSKSTGMKAALGFGVLYMAWVFLIAYMEDFWVYPFMEKMNPLQLAIFFGGAHVFVMVLYLTGDLLARRSHGLMEVSDENDRKTN